MGRLTLRQFFLLLGEYYTQQRLEDGRVYRLLCVWSKDQPRLEVMFPSFNITAEQVDELADDLASFQQVTASLTPYRN
jgi:hypothetical protein